MGGMPRMLIPYGQGFDVDEAVRAIRQMNASEAMVAADRLLDQHFRPIAQCFRRPAVVENVVLLDGLYGTQLFRDEKGAADRIAGALASASDRVIALLEPLAVDTLEREPEAVVSVARQVLPVVLEQGREDAEQARQHYSFASKFYHWVTREHFPVVDSVTRERINALQTRLNVSHGVRKSRRGMRDLTCVEEYGRWVLFYGDLIATIAADDREALLKADYDSQPERPVRNSLLRVLDKVFYTLGGGSGLGRVMP